MRAVHNVQQAAYLQCMNVVDVVRQGYHHLLHVHGQHVDANDADGKLRGRICSHVCEHVNVVLARTVFIGAVL